MNIKAVASGSTGNLYLVSCGSDKLMIEAGIQFRRILKATAYTLADYAACLISHEHMDHARCWKQVSERGVPVLMTKGTANALQAKDYEYKRIKSMDWICIGRWKILPFETRHDVEEPVGFIIVHGNSRLLYATDTFLVKYKFEGLTHIMIECNHVHAELMEQPRAVRQRLYGTHLSLETCLEYLNCLDLNNVTEIHLIHISKERGDPERYKRCVQDMTGIPVRVEG